MKTTLTAATLSGPEVQRLNSAFAWVCALLSVALPLAVLYQLMTTPTDNLLLRAGTSLSAVQVAMLDVALWQRLLTVGLGSNELITLLFAGMVWQIAAVMSRAVALAEENAH